MAKLCTELKFDAFEACEKLRYATRESRKYPELTKHNRRQASEFVKNGPALEEARAELTAKE